MKNAHNAYKQTSVTTASREKILLMLYEGAIKFTKRAMECMEAKMIPEKGEAISKVQDIINELNNSLNHEVGGDISRNLESLYTFMIDQTTEANINNDVEPLKVTLDILNTLHEAWIEAAEKVRREGGLQNVKLPPRKEAKKEPSP